MNYLKKTAIMKSRDAEAAAKAEEGTLYITDSSVIAESLVEKGCAVLVCLHEENRQENFSFCKYAYEGQPGGELPDMEFLEHVYRRCRGLPWDILQTERCLVRETTVEDVEVFYKIYSEPSITKYMEPLYEDPEQERAYAENYITQVYAFYGFGIWTVEEKSSGEVIGRAGICFREGYEDPELGFVIAADRQGRGLATEVCGAILRYGSEELGFERILAFVQPGNTASRRVCEKLGMKMSKQVTLQGQEYELFVWTSCDTKKLQNGC